MEIATTKMSSKGQIVIPAKMREDIKEGEEILILKEGNQIIMKKVSNLNENFEKDLEFAKRTNEAFENYLEGKFVEISADDFSKELDKW